MREVIFRKNDWSQKSENRSLCDVRRARARKMLSRFQRPFAYRFAWLYSSALKLPVKNFSIKLFTQLVVQGFIIIIRPSPKLYLTNLPKTTLPRTRREWQVETNSKLSDSRDSSWRCESRLSMVIGPYAEQHINKSIDYSFESLM